MQPLWTFIPFIIALALASKPDGSPQPACVEGSYNLYDELCEDACNCPGSNGGQYEPAACPDECQGLCICKYWDDNHSPAPNPNDPARQRCARSCESKQDCMEEQLVDEHCVNCMPQEPPPGVTKILGHCLSLTKNKREESNVTCIGFDGSVSEEHCTYNTPLSAEEACLIALK